MKNQEIHQVHDKGYKELYSNKTVFLDLLQNLLKLDWAQGIQPEDLTKIDKTYVTSDYSELESDLVYRIQDGGQDAIVYVLMEMQSSVDYRMPIRLLEYMVELLREYLKEKKYHKHDSHVKIPAIYPIVMYNGKEPWKAKRSLREITENGERYGEGLLNFRYCLVDVNHGYTEDELMDNDCMNSIILLLDKEAGMEELIRRLEGIVERFQSLREGNNREILTHWVTKSAEPIIKEGMVQILNAEKEEAKKMISNLGNVLERVKREGVLEGRREGVLEGRREGVLEGRRKGRQEGYQQCQEEIIKALLKTGIPIEAITKAVNIEPNKFKDLYKS